MARRTRKVEQTDTFEFAPLGIKVSMQRVTTDQIVMALKKQQRQIVYLHQKGLEREKEIVDLRLAVERLRAERAEKEKRKPSISIVDVEEDESVR